jgi:hypothetical protein
MKTKTKSSNGSIPRGLTLYEFEFPRDSFIRPFGSFCENDQVALEIARAAGAVVVYHILSGRILLVPR